MLENRIDPALIDGFVARAFEGVAQYFHDVSDNPNIANPDDGWAHAAVLVQYLNRLCGRRAEKNPSIQSTPIAADDPNEPR